MSNAVEINWLNEPEEHDYPAALSYLSLIYDEQTATNVVEKLKNAPMAEFKAKDIFRASSLSLLGVSNAHIEKDQKKIEKGRELSPLLLVRDASNGKVIVADGYHRLCAVYSYNEDSIIPCKIA
jgi:disulfide oxidoreductase YuzD